MVNKHVLRETFMKLESYDRINVISDILRLSNSLELEFYSSVIESILQYHKLSVTSLRDDLNNENNLKCFMDSDCTDSNVRSKLISTLSLLKASNVNGASQIFEFLRQNHIKLKEQAHKNPNAYEEVLLIYQLANDHPAFSFDHCQEIYDYLTQIRLISVSRDYFIANNNDEYVNDLNVLTIAKNDKQQYVYRIKVKWDHYECCIIRTLEEVYHFYQKLSEMFPLEIRNGEICPFYLSYIQDNLDLSHHLMTTFFRDFLNSPQLVLRCDFVRQFFKPRTSDKHICACNSCEVNFNKLHWAGDRKFDPVTKCSSPNNPSDIDEYPQCYDNKADTSCSSSLNFSTNSTKCRNGSNLPLEVTISNRTSSSDDSESSVASRRKKTKIYHSTGSSPINTPSDESEPSSKNESLKNQQVVLPRQLNVVMTTPNMTPSLKDIRTENWLSQSSKIVTIESVDNSRPVRSNTDLMDHYEDDTDTETNSFDLSNIDQCLIGNLHDWLKHTRLHKYHSNLNPMTFGKFHSLNEEALNDLGFVEGASKKLVSLIRKIKRSDIVEVEPNVVNITLRERSSSSDSGTSMVSSCGDYCQIQKQPDNRFLALPQPQQTILQPFNFNYFVPANCFMFPPNFIHNLMMVPADKSDKNYQGNKPCGPQ